MRERWVVISNCQSFGLANSIEAQAKTIECTACDVHEFRRAIAENPEHFRAYDFALILPEAFDGIDRDATGLPPYRLVPAFQFPAYHPDSVYVFADGAFVEGVIGSYQSMIALAAYKEGLAAEQAATFFDARIYQAAGYFSQYDPYRTWLVEHFAAHDIDIAPIFLRRTRGAALMHTVNHPAIAVLFDLARAILVQMERPIFADVTPPSDNLAGISWPIYPEVGERLGLPGNYLFKPAYRHKPLDLIGFLGRSLEHFAPWHRSQLSVIPNLVQPLRRIRRHMRDGL